MLAPDPSAHAQTGKLTELARVIRRVRTWKSLSVSLNKLLAAPECCTHTPARRCTTLSEGATAQGPNGKPVDLFANTAQILVRDVPHGGLRVIGDKTLKLLSVHKGKPITVPVKP